MMFFKNTIFLGMIAMLFTELSAHAQDSKPIYQKTNSGVQLKYRDVPAALDQDIYLDFYTEQAVRIRVTPPDTKKPNNESLLLVDTVLKRRIEFSVSQVGDSLFVKTSGMQVKAFLPTGSLHFFDAQGKPLVREGARNAVSFQKDAYDGDSFFNINQSFEISADEGLYGLGQHQNGVMNYNNGRRVSLLQYNTEIAVPFLVSTNNYGILWHNYSITTAGDTRPLLPLHAFKLFSHEGRQGWLTARYVNKENEAEVYAERPESTIDYNYLSDQHKYPQGTLLSKCKVYYEGEFASPYAGLHYLHFKYSGYIKVYIDGKLLQDRWREAWNSGTFELPVTLERDKRHRLRIEWTPVGNESYFTLNWQRPQEEGTPLFGFRSEAGDAIDYFVFAGENMDNVISGYRQLTGKAGIMPRWSFGYWQSRERYKTQAELEEVAQIFRKRRIPIDNIVQDWSYWSEKDWGSHVFDPKRFPDPDGMIDRLHQQHFKLMISVWPKINEESTVFDEFNRNNWLYMRNIYDGRKDWIGKGYTSTFYDVYNPAARNAFWKQMNTKLFSKGIDAWWMDASEPDIHSNISVEERKAVLQPSIGSSVRYYNTFPLLNAKGIYDGQRATDSSKRVFILTRSFFAGQQRYGAAAWSGDIASTWEDMKDQISAGVNFSMSGTPYWTMDAGGFLVQRKYYDPNEADLEEWRELNSRWYQYGAFLPLFRAHGQFPAREPFAIAPEEHPAYKSMLYYINLRYRLLAYNYSIAAHTYLNDYSMIRGLAMDFSADTAVYNINDQFMWGPSLLVNPVSQHGERKRAVYLPAGKGWYDLYRGRYFAAGQTIEADAPYDRIPVFVPAGAILPWGEPLQYTSEKPQDVLTLLVYEGQDGEFVLYEDAGDNYDYEKSAYSTIKFSFDNQHGILSLGDRKGTFEGMTKQRKFNVLLVGSNSLIGIDALPKNMKSVKYNGRAMNIKLR
ncbi:glycoside hydrolase family 31 protein [Sphingobacterium bambusae]|uniref:TIM-barrel domain-containing protein n=1 Tax=Sphingobacterium bambusae TaxID=662858 RepID=A0ABW6BCM4_9SPHI|nr:TIM-barrel domain-containing protein [Sphingobacterium bambusae]WPL48560.1 glycoside hydrolase family 31 protein [Sphingobacterium bambusae]